MSEQTIGRFISDLRKSKGMTQKELAHKLNVSDKTVSRWENDDSNPDLQLIPAIADIFGVTCDELLRGEKIAANQNADTRVFSHERELQKSLLRFKNLSYISYTIFALGIILSLLTELMPFWISPSLKCSLNFAISTFLYSVSVICQLIILNISLNSAKSKLNSDDLNLFKKKSALGTEFIIGLETVMFGLSIPTLIKALAISIDGKEIFYRALFSLIFATVFGLFTYYYNKSHFDDETLKYNGKLILKVCISAICVLLCLFLIFNVLVSNAKPIDGYETISFDTQKDFNDYNDSLNADGDAQYSELKLPNGNVLKYNSNLKIIETNFSKAEDFFPMEIKIEVQKYSKRDIVYFLQDIFSVIYAIDFAAILIIYIAKRKKIK